MYIFGTTLQLPNGTRVPLPEFLKSPQSTSRMSAPCGAWPESGCHVLQIRTMCAPVLSASVCTRQRRQNVPKNCLLLTVQAAASIYSDLFYERKTYGRRTYTWFPGSQCLTAFWDGCLPTSFWSRFADEANFQQTFLTANASCLIFVQWSCSYNNHSWCVCKYINI